MHWIRIGAIPEIWQRLEAVGHHHRAGLRRFGAQRPLLPGLRASTSDEVVDAYPVAVAISDFFTGNREYANLPRKFKMSVTGCREDCAQAEINDLALVPARLDDGTVGFNLLVGGGLSDGPRLASDVDVFVRPDEAVEISRAVAQLFDELGNRENRWTCRMRYLVQELGPETIPRGVGGAGAHSADPGRRAPDASATAATTSASTAQKQAGLSYVGVNVTVGRMSGRQPGRGGAAGGDVRRRRNPPDHRPELHLHRHPRGATGRVCWPSRCCRRTRQTRSRSSGARWPAPATSSAASPSSRPRRGRCNGHGARPPGEPRRRRDRAHALLRLLRLLRPATDRRHRLPRRDGQDRRRRSSRRSISAWAAASGRDAAFIDWVEGAKPADEVPDALVRLFDRLQRASGARASASTSGRAAHRMRGLRATLRSGNGGPA